MNVFTELLLGFTAYRFRHSRKRFKILNRFLLVAKRKLTFQRTLDDFAYQVMLAYLALKVKQFDQKSQTKMYSRVN